MARISSDSINAVRDAADIAEVIGAYTDLKRHGAQMMGLCPFHDERSPSFSVDPQDKLYHCFGCGVAGDVFGFVMEKEGLGFSEAVEVAATSNGGKKYSLGSVLGHVLMHQTVIGIESLRQMELAGEMRTARTIYERLI